jgi:hypothetical protein
VVFVGQPGGVLVAGRPGAIESAVAHLIAISRTERAPSSTVADLAAIGTTAGAFIATNGEYVRLTGRSIALLAEHSSVSTGAGSCWGFVRDSVRIRGILDFERVDLAPEQMMALQSAAVSLALRAAIREVQAAVERVEGKVDDVLGLLRSERIGDVLGTHRALDPLVERARHNRRISTTDWSSEAAKDIEALRAHIRSTLEAADGGWRPGDRIDDAERLFETKGLLAESIALLVVAEHNLAAWHELRIAHVRINEPDHLTWTIEDAQASIAAQNEDDQLVVDALRVVAERLTTPMEYDGLAPWQRHELSDARSKLDDLAAWFADQRMLDLVPLGMAPYPTVRESLGNVTRNVEEVAGRSLDRLRKRIRGGDSDTAELERPPADPPRG